MAAGRTMLEKVWPEVVIVQCSDSDDLQTSLGQAIASVLDLRLPHTDAQTTTRRCLPVGANYRPGHACRLTPRFGRVKEPDAPDPPDASRASWGRSP